MTFPFVSTCPSTKWPSSESVHFAAGSKLTMSPFFSVPIVVFAAVSVIISASNDVFESFVIVRQTPFTAIESPTFLSFIVFFAFNLMVLPIFSTIPVSRTIPVNIIFWLMCGHIIAFVVADCNFKFFLFGFNENLISVCYFRLA